MKRSDFAFILKSYSFWVLLLVFALGLSKWIVLQPSFLGGGISNHLSNPFFWAWANFDGEHYIAIARSGYTPLTYFFFPGYIFSVKLLTYFFGDSIFNYLISGIFISHASLIVALTGLYNLVKDETDKKVARITLIIFLLFPTSFFLGAVYTESFFLMFLIWCIYFARKGNFLAAGILGACASATRVVGIALLPVLVAEMLLHGKKSFNFKNILSISISGLGLFSYMFYLQKVTGSFLEFFNNISIFGEQRQSAFIMLPQVFYRYFFKIIPSLNFDYLPVVFTTFLELGSAILVFIVLIVSLRKMRFSYWLLMFLLYLIPTFSGSFSSLPRYVLIIFPMFIFLANYLKKRPIFLFVFLAVSFILLLVSFTLFARGYWIS